MVPPIDILFLHVSLEERHAAQLGARLRRREARRVQPFVIGIAGGTASGKTTARGPRMADMSLEDGKNSKNQASLLHTHTHTCKN